MRRLLAAVFAVAALGLGAARPSAAAPPLGPHRAVPDASVADAGVAAADAGERRGDKATLDVAAKAAAQQAELDQMREQVTALRERTAVLEDRLARVDGVTTQLGQLIRQVEGLRADVADAASSREDERHQAQQHAADVHDAINGLMWAESQLSTGTTDIGSQLDRAQGVLTTPQAAFDLQSARAALANKDLLNARLYLYQAIVDSQQAH